LLIALAACGSSTTSGTYTIAFQSTDEAVATDMVTVRVFDANANGGKDACAHLLALAASNQDLPASLSTIGPTPLCDLRGGGGFSAPFSSVALLVTARAKGGMNDLARGCATQTISADVTSVTVEMSLAQGMAVTPTKCSSLSQHCGGGC
jgi:hypothetical protein